MITLKTLKYASLILLLFVSGSQLAAADSQPDKSPLSFHMLREYAGFANATYLPESKLRQQTLPENYTLSHYGNIPDLQIAYFLATNEVSRTQLIAVRGTANIENALIDVAVKLTQDEHAGIRLHNGFAQAAQAIYTEILPLLKKDYVIDTTGHSLGGAVALILARYLDEDNFNIGRVVTFGQPKVTNITGAASFEHLSIIRVVTPQDLVPLVPPLDPLDINDLDIYWHPGIEILLNPDDSYSLLKGVNSMLRATKFTQQPLNENNLQHHQMTLYIKLLDNKLANARLVEFKNSFNLFNLFGSEQK